MCVVCVCLGCVVCVFQIKLSAPPKRRPQKLLRLWGDAATKIRGGLAWLAETLIMFVVLPLLPLLLLCCRQLTVRWHIMRTQQQPRRLNRRRAVGVEGTATPGLDFGFCLHLQLVVGTEAVQIAVYYFNGTHVR